MSEQDETRWGLIATKRPWIPEWLWKALGQSVLRQPLRWITTRQPTPEEALRSWASGDE